MAVRRFFGWADDATVGGKTLDGLRVDPTDPTEVPAIPDATQLWPVTNVTVDKGVSLLDRTNEVRSVRGNSAPQEFRHDPRVTVEGRLYMPILRKLLALWASGTPTPAGGTGTPITGVTGVTATDIFTKTAHGLTAGKLVLLSALTGGSALSVATPYYVITVTANTFQLASQVGGTPVDLGTDVSAVTVTNPAATTTTYPPLGFGAAGLKSVHLGIVRDDLYEKVAGCTLSELELNFPNDDHATFRAVFMGMYRSQETAAPPSGLTFSYLNPDAALVLRDAQLLLDGAGTGIAGFRGFSLKLDNTVRDPQYWPKQNRLRVPAASGDRERTIWWPANRKLGSAQQITGSLEFFDVKTAQETKHDLARAQAAILEVEGGALGTTPASRQLLRTTLNAMVLTGGGASPLVRDDDITTQYDFGAFLDAANQDVKFEVVDAN